MFPLEGDATDFLPKAPGLDVPLPSGLPSRPRTDPARLVAVPAPADRTGMARLTAVPARCRHRCPAPSYRSVRWLCGSLVVRAAGTKPGTTCS